MADRVVRYRSLTAAGLGTEATTGIIESAIRARGGVEVHAVGPGRLSVSRTRRPTWAVIACAGTVWIGGLGLLFLLVTETESGEVGVVEGPRGASVTLPPLLDGSTVQAIEAALRADATPGADAARPATPRDDDLEGRTVARDRSAAVATPSTPPIAPTRVALRFDGAALTVEPGRPVVLGRDPSPTAGGAAWRVPGDATTVSKSHLLVAFDGATLTVEDLGSTNGSTVVRDGTERRLPVETPTAVVDGDRVAVGAVEFVVDARPTGEG